MNKINLVAYFILYFFTILSLIIIFIYFLKKIKNDIFEIYNMAINMLSIEIVKATKGSEKVLMSNIEKTYDEFIKISKKQKNIYDEFEELNGVVNLMANKIEVLNSQLNVRAQLENEILKLKKIIKRLEVR
jgi:hypothetical protein